MVVWVVMGWFHTGVGISHAAAPKEGELCWGLPLKDRPRPELEDWSAAMGVTPPFLLCTCTKKGLSMVWRKPRAHIAAKRKGEGFAPNLPSHNFSAAHLRIFAVESNFTH